MAEYTFNSLVKEIAERKNSLSKSRFQKAEKIEIPREVYLACCKEIAEHYEPLGFKYAKSTQTLKLKKGEFVFQLSFQSSRYNVADENVAMIVHAGVSSSKLKKWRKESPYAIFSEHVHGSLGGGQIGNLRKDTSWLKWNVADPKTRDKTINEIIEHINSLALSFFDKFSDLEKLKETFINEGEHYSIPATTFLMYFFSKRELEQSLETFLTKRDFWGKYKSALKEIMKTEERVINSTYWVDIAQTKVDLDLTLVEPLNS